MDKLTSKLLGDPEEFTLEHQILNLILLFGFFLFLFAAIINIFIREPPIVTEATIIGFFILVFIYYLSRRKKKFYISAFLVFSFTLFVYTPFMWIHDGGLMSGYPYFIVVYVAMVISVCRGFRRYFFVISTFLVTAVLLMVEYLHPEYIRRITDQKILLINTTFSFAFSIITISLLLIIYTNRYMRETEKVKRLNISLVEANKKLDMLSRIDPLTGLSNRRDFLEKIEREIGFYRREKRPFSIMISDIDNFKNVNDKYGHDCGDYILKELGKLFKTVVRQIDEVGRWGGEEFIFLFPNTNVEDAFVIAERIRKIVASKTFVYKNNPVKITMTFGLTQYNPEISINENIKIADSALYKGKKLGKNIVVKID